MLPNEYSRLLTSWHYVLNNKFSYIYVIYWGFFPFKIMICSKNGKICDLCFILQNEVNNFWDHFITFIISLSRLYFPYYDVLVMHVLQKREFPAFQIHNEFQWIISFYWLKSYEYDHAFISISFCIIFKFYCTWKTRKARIETSTKINK